MYIDICTYITIHIYICGKSGVCRNIATSIEIKILLRIKRKFGFFLKSKNPSRFKEKEFGIWD